MGFGIPSLIHLPHPSYKSFMGAPLVSACLHVSRVSAEFGRPIPRGGKWGDITHFVLVTEWKTGSRHFIFSLLVSCFVIWWENLQFLGKPNSQCKFFKELKDQMNVQVYLHVICDSECFLSVLLWNHFFSFVFFCHYLIKVVNLIFYYHDLYYLIFKVNSFKWQRIPDELTKNTFSKLFWGILPSHLCPELFLIKCW